MGGGNLELESRSRVWITLSHRWVLGDGPTYDSVTSDSTGPLTLCHRLGHYGDRCHLYAGEEDDDVCHNYTDFLRLSGKFRI